ncbi:MAG: 1,4-alpha-glucan branching protein GlgB [bacterium]
MAQKDRKFDPAEVPAEELDRLAGGDHADPHSILGAHPVKVDGKAGVVIRAFHPDAVLAEVLLGEGPVRMERIHDGGVFALFVEGWTFPLKYRLKFHFSDGHAWECGAPYRFMPTLGDLDLYFSAEGTHYRIHEKLGAHIREVDGERGVSFAVWAPNARRVSVVGEFNNWDGRLFPMRLMGSSGIWEIFIPGVQAGQLYKYEIKTAAGELRIKTDPLAFSMQLPPGTASRVFDVDSCRWADGEWMENRINADPRFSPMAVYEVHLGSWMRDPGQGDRWLTYRELAPRLVEHAKAFGFTHLELLPVCEHPLDASWGYQVTGYFAPTARFGSPDDFKYFVDYCHRNGIGVILDWVPAHFPKDDFSLRFFDGTCLYEHADPRQAEQSDWGTLIFNFGRNEVRNFLISNALFWLDRYHIDALRVDAVASMLYLNFGRKNDEEWVPNKYGGRENLEAIEFIRAMNKAVYTEYPGCFTIAEESSDWRGITLPTYLGGLGFGFKWDMGWMHDTLRYLNQDPVFRPHRHNDLTFSMWYANDENYLLPLSHDEVVHMKGSLYWRMAGDAWQKFANLRLLYSYMYTHPGKKLLFMGSEFAQEWEWKFDASLDWHQCDDPPRRGLIQLLQELGRLYQQKEALWALDAVRDGFSWIDCSDWEQSIVSYVRRGRHSHLVCVLNFTPVPRYGYRVGVPADSDYDELINTDSGQFGGSNVGNEGRVKVEKVRFHGYDQSLSLTLPPLACLILEPVKLR